MYIVFKPPCIYIFLLYIPHGVHPLKLMNKVVGIADYKILINK